MTYKSKGIDDCKPINIPNLRCKEEEFQKSQQKLEGPLTIGILEGLWESGPKVYPAAVERDTPASMVVLSGPE